MDGMDTGAPATADTAPPSAQPVQQAAPQQAPAGQQPPAQQQPPAGAQDKPFELPEAYKNKPWAAKIKSADDLYKQIDNLDQLVGKKVVAPIDFNSATPEEIEAHYAKTRPADKSAYKFKEPDAPFNKAIADTFHKYGVPEHQANSIIAEVDKAIQQVAAEHKTKAQSADEYAAMSKKAFGDGFESVIVNIENTIKAFTSDEDKAAFDNMDNATRAAVDRMLHRHMGAQEARISKILKEHGVSESAANANGGKGGSPAEDKAALRSQIRQQIRDLENGPHTADQRATLQNKLNQLL